MPAQQVSRCQSRALTSSSVWRWRAKGGVACAVQSAASPNTVSAATLATTATAIFEATVTTADTVLMALAGWLAGWLLLGSPWGAAPCRRWALRNDDGTRAGTYEERCSGSGECAERGWSVVALGETVVLSRCQGFR